LNAETDKTITVAENTGALANNRGWNLIGQPFLSKYIASEAVGEFDIYVYDGVADNYTPWTKATAPTINPFSAYFIQASNTLAGTGISFAAATGGRTLAPSVAANELKEEVQLNFKSATGSDYALLRMDNAFTTSYEIGSDFEKWIGTGTSKPQIYTSLNGINYAFNGLPMSSVDNLPVGIYTKTAGTTTISANGSKASSLSQLLLTDKSTSPATVTDLLVSNYTFIAAAGTNNSRFAITAHRVPTANVNVAGAGDIKLSIANSQLLLTDLTVNSTIRVFDALGRMVASKIATSNALEISLKAKGIYTVQLQKGTSISTQKVIF